MYTCSFESAVLDNLVTCQRYHSKTSKDYSIHTVKNNNHQIMKTMTCNIEIRIRNQIKK